MRSPASALEPHICRDVWVGTSGWTYDSLRGPFYPTDVPKTNWLVCYASRFATAEINGSFYRTPSEEAVRKGGFGSKTFNGEHGSIGFESESQLAMANLEATEWRWQERFIAEGVEGLLHGTRTWATPLHEGMPEP